MMTFNLAMAFGLAAFGQISSVSDPRTLVDLIESLQPEIRDFRCEFEGTLRLESNEVKKIRGLREDGLYNTFSGAFIWKAGGNTNLDVLHRHEPTGEITHEQLVFTDDEAQHLIRLEDRPLGSGTIENPNITNSDRSGSLGEIFLIESIKRLVVMIGMEATLSEETIEGRPCTVLSITQQSTGMLLQKFFLDMKRGGHAIRRESYSGEENLVSRSDITLDQFEVDGVTVWMPVSAEIESHSSIKDGKPFFPKEPTSVEKIYIVGGTLQFNRNPPASAFSIDFKPGTPISDKLRRARYEFGQQKPSARTTVEEAEGMLREQLAAAEAQGKELVAVSPARRRFRWSSMFVWVFGVVALASSLILVLRRR